jgi:hypothetical protein
MDENVIIDRGIIIDTTINILIYLVKNLEIVEYLAEKKVNVKRIDDKTWIANKLGFKVKAKIEDIYKNDDNNSGYFYYSVHNNWNFFPLSSIIKFDYEKISENSIYVHGYFEFEITGILKIIPKSKKYKVYEFLDTVSIMLKNVSESLYSDFDNTIKKLDKENYKKIKELKKMLLQTNKNWINKTILNSLISDLEKKYPKDLFKEIYVSLKLLDVNFESCLMNNRKIVDRILKELLSQNKINFPETQKTGFLLDKLDNSGVVPREIIRHIRLIIDLGSLAAHTNETNDAIISSITTCKVIKWYLGYSNF